MKEIIFNKKKYKSYKDFYSQIYRELNGKSTVDWEDYNDLYYSADNLDEFLWYKADENIRYVFFNFDKEKVSLQKNFNDYQYNLIFEVFEDFVKKHPNNKLEFRMSEEK